MKFDRNTVIGFTVLAVLFIGYFYFTNKQQSEYRKTQADAAKIERAKKDSIDALRKPAEDSAKKVMDSITKVSNVGNFGKALDSTEKLTIIENKLMKITFTSRGGRVKQVELKNYKEHDSSLVKLAATEFDKIGYRQLIYLSHRLILVQKMAIPLFHLHFRQKIAAGHILLMSLLLSLMIT